jgi:hypothetical protein
MTRRKPRNGRENELVSKRSDDGGPIAQHQALTAGDSSQSSPLAPFILGTVVGGLAGAILGTALSSHTRGFLVGLFHLVSRRLSSSDRDQLRFELLLQ